MKSNYKQTFDAVHMSPNSRQRIRSELSARINENQKENNIVSIKSRSTKKLVTVLIAAVLALSLTTVVAFAYGSQIIQMLGGGQLVVERNSASISVPVDGPAPVDVVDGKVYFILDGSRKDITSYCTESTYYMHEYIADNGFRHVYIVGGNPDNLGWAEFIWDDSGYPLASSITFPPNTDLDHPPQWFEDANKALEFNSHW